MIPIICAVISTGCAVFVAFRTGRWRETDDAKVIAARFQKIEGRLDIIETKQLELPSKADLAKLEGSINLVKELVERSERGIDRIESYMLNHGKA
jgi:hypothetical protein